MVGNYELNLNQLIKIAEALDDLLPSVTFVGGCTTVLLVDESAYSGVRQTDDVVVDVASYLEYQHFPAALRERDEGPYKVQFDKVGALIVWCKDESGNVVSSHSTSYHARFADILETRIVEKGSGETLTIELEQRGARVLITDTF